MENRLQIMLNKNVELPAECIESLQCTSCSNILSIPPIWYDKNAKIYYCGRCIDDEKSNNNGSLIRVEIFETLAKAFIFSCQYQNYGCTQKYDFQSGKEHETSCKFQPIKCPFHVIEQCRRCGTRNRIKEHLQKAHRKHEIDLENFEIKTNLNYTLIKYGIILEQTFILKIAGTSAERCWIKICHIGEPSETVQMSYDLSIMKKLDSGRKMQIRKQMENYSTGVIDTNTMEEIETSVLQKFFNDTNLWVSIKIIDNNTVPVKKIPQPTDQKILSELECPICKEFMLKHIIICANGHSFCEGCRPKLSYCPSCRCRMSDARNYTLESLAKILVYPCRTEMCSFIGDANEYLNHQQVVHH